MNTEPFTPQMTVRSSQPNPIANKKGGRGKISPTPRQAAVLSVIERWFAQRGVAPSFGEIMAATGTSSRQGVFEALTGLEERGHIRRQYNRVRGIELVDPAPEKYTYPAPGLVRRDAAGEVVEACRLRFIALKDIRPLNLKMIARGQ